MSDSKKIALTMESVINSVKKRQKRKKELVQKSETEISDISNILSNSLSIISPDLSIDEVTDHVKTPQKENVAHSKRNSKGKYKKTSSALKSLKKSSLQSLAIDGNTLLSPSKGGSIRDHFSPKVKNEIGQVNAETSLNNAEGYIETIAEKLDGKMNAFDLMMNARNRSIGSNTPGKENPNKEENLTESPEVAAKVKRKLLLEEWAERKGALKRKVDDVAREEYIEYQLSKRAKRLKTMLVNGSSLKNIEKVVKEKDLHKKKNKEEQSKDSTVLVKNLTQSKKLEGSTVKKCKVIELRNRGGSINDIQSPSVQETFTQKLSSPIKKRDSLFGYFPKVEDSQPAVKTCESEAKKFYSESSSRPKRSCTGKPKYDYDLELSPVKRCNVKQKRGQTSNTKCVQKVKENVVCLDLTDETEKSKKLAPVFAKHLPKPSLDPEIIKAKQEFLMSGIPEKMKIEITKQKEFVAVYSNFTDIFPRISHVQQFEDKINKMREINWNKYGIIWHEDDQSPARNKKNIPKSGIELSQYIISSNNERNTLPPLSQLNKIANKVCLLKNLKVLFEKFPTYKCYNQLRQKYKYFHRKDIYIGTEEVADTFLITNIHSACDSVTEVGEEYLGCNGDLLFTEKYKPNNSEEILVNFQPIKRLKEFLSSFQSGQNIRQKYSILDFEGSNDSSCSMTNISNFMVLHGPSSSGKTNAVFALANEMNFKVLEINAGMKRTGKKLLQELLEATQSHRVGRDTKTNNSKKILNEPKAKGNYLNDYSSSSSDLGSIGKLSLILIEDAELIFEQDAGFVEAIYQLTATSKRPVIITSNNSDSQHLLRLKNQHNIEFKMPNVLNISKFLSVMSLVENCPLELDDIINLYVYNNTNLRKTILEIQFFIQSGGDRLRENAELSKRKLSSDENLKEDQDYKFEKSKNAGNLNFQTHKTMFDFYTCNQNISSLVQYPVDFTILHQNLVDVFASAKHLNSEEPNFKKRGRRSKNHRKLQSKYHIFDDHNLLHLSNFYDNISVASLISPEQIEDRLQNNFAEDISHALVETSLKVDLGANEKVRNCKKITSERAILSRHLSTNYLRTFKALELDYEPCLRSICRHEKLRSAQERRSSRFYHYLRNVCTSTTSFSTQEFDEACNIFILENNKIAEA